MTDFVELRERRNRGWPWPESSFGMDPMYGADGWCRGCGIPLREQSGSLVLQRKGMRPVGAWVPYWSSDICMSAELADQVLSRFDVEVREVGWHASSPGPAMQLLVPTVGDQWFDPDELRRRASVDTPPVGGKLCGQCGRWKWSPLEWTELPRVLDPGQLGAGPIVASPEWFGGGLVACRQVLVDRELAELIARRCRSCASMVNALALTRPLLRSSASLARRALRAAADEEAVVPAGGSIVATKISETAPPARSVPMSRP